MPNVRTRFFVANVGASAPSASGGGTQTVSLQPVYQGSPNGQNTVPENAVFGPGQPAASINIVVADAASARTFLPGREFFVDFLPIDEHPNG